MNMDKTNLDDDVEDYEDVEGVDETHDQSFFILPNGVYDTFRLIVQILLPGVGALYAALAPLWGFGRVDQVVGTLSAVAVFLGLLLGASRRAYHGSSASYDGVIHIRHNEDATRSLRMVLNDTPEGLESRKTGVTFKVQND